MKNKKSDWIWNSRSGSSRVGRFVRNAAIIATQFGGRLTVTERTVLGSNRGQIKWKVQDCFFFSFCSWPKFATATCCRRPAGPRSSSWTWSGTSTWTSGSSSGRWASCRASKEAVSWVPAPVVQEFLESFFSMGVELTASSSSSQSESVTPTLRRFVHSLIIPYLGLDDDWLDQVRLG